VFVDALLIQQMWADASAGRIVRIFDTEDFEDVVNLSISNRLSSGAEICCGALRQRTHEAMLAGHLDLRIACRLDLGLGHATVA
jgi:hypothetical protein